MICHDLGQKRYRISIMRYGPLSPRKGLIELELLFTWDRQGHMKNGHWLLFRNWDGYGSIYKGDFYNSGDVESFND